MKFKVGAALFINGASCFIYKGSKMDLDSWSSSLYKWVLQLAIASWSSSLYKGSNFTVGAQHIYYIIFSTNIGEFKNTHFNLSRLMLLVATSIPRPPEKYENLSKPIKNLYSLISYATMKVIIKR